MLVDSHCHLDRLDLAPFEGDLEAALNAAQTAGVSHILSVCVTLDDFPDIVRFARTHATVFASLGVHPSELPGEVVAVDDLLRLGKDPCVIAIGETGLDYHYNDGDLTWQQDRFRDHIEVAKQLGKPLIIHTRDARDDTLAIMREQQAEQIGGVMHCFTETWEMAKAALELGFYISLSGILTFKNADALRDVAQRVPLDRLLIETDSPYLTPVPHRGKPNQPAYVRLVAEQLATLRGENLETIAKQTTQNFFDCFKLETGFRND